MNCPSGLELDRAYSVGADASLADHLAVCARCAAAWRATAELVQAARSVQAPPPRRRSAEELRTALLAAPMAPSRAGRRRLGYGVALAAAAALVAGAVLTRRGPRAPLAAGHGHVIAGGAARYHHVPFGPDELVRLTEGVIDVEVTPLAAGERFRVIVGDAEVEVRGTAFVVTAAADRLRAVHVAHGAVAVRVGDGPAQLLEAGGTWQADDGAPADAAGRDARADAGTSAPPVAAATTDVADAPGDHAAPPRPRRPPPPPPPPPALPPPARAPEALAYDDGWRALRGDDFRAAAAAFARVVALAPEGPLADEARYWTAVARARDHRRAEAIAGFRELLDERAGAGHRGEAAVMLGWLLVETGELAEATRRFASAADDGAPAVRASARDGLAAVGAVAPRGE